MSLFVPDVTDISLRLDACILSCTSHSSSNLANAMEKVKPLKRLIIVERDAVSQVRIPSILGNGDTSHPRLEFLLVMTCPCVHIVLNHGWCGKGKASRMGTQPE
jgi:hypothetical protein